MIIFHPPLAEPRRHKIGRTEFIVQAYFCGHESIYYKLANLMENELEDVQNIPQCIENIDDFPLDDEPV